jgi:TRAP-type C4-dicarboxylate transport system permease small subunit
MRHLFLFILLLFLAGTPRLRAQCSICTRTAQQMGERPAKALNSGIIYLAITPLAIFGLLGYRWWKSNHAEEEPK